MSSVLAALGALAPWAVVFVASVVGVFVVFTGVALFVALFDDDEARAARAQVILRDLLRLFGWGAR